MSTIIGRSRQEDVPLIVAEIQRIFEADYVTRLNAALMKIDELQKVHNWIIVYNIYRVCIWLNYTFEQEH